MKCANKSTCTFEGFGRFNGIINGHKIILEKVFYSKDINKNLIGGVKLAMDGYNATILYKNDNIYLKIFKNNYTIGEFATNNTNTFVIPSTQYYKPDINSTELNNQSLMLWHQRLGHFYQKDISKYLELHNIKTNNCLECAISKLKSKPHNKIPPKAQKVLETIHSDIMGPINPVSQDNFKYIITFIDEFSRKSWVNLMKEKSEAVNIIINFIKYINNHFENKIKYFKSDNGREYNNSRIKKFCRKMGIKKIFSIPYNPQNNGIAERYNQTLQNATKTLIHWAKLSLDFWSFAVIYSNFLYNITPHENISNLIPNEIFYNRKVNLDKVKVFGCVMHYNNTMNKNSKFEPNTKQGIFLGINFDSNSYIAMDFKDQSIHLVREAIFQEDLPANYIFNYELHKYNNNNNKNTLSLNYNNNIDHSLFENNDDLKDKINNQNNLKHDINNKDAPQNEPNNIDENSNNNDQLNNKLSSDIQHYNNSDDSTTLNNSNTHTNNLNNHKSNKRTLDIDNNMNNKRHVI